MEITKRQRKLLRRWNNKKQAIKVKELDELISLGLIEYWSDRTDYGYASYPILSSLGKHILNPDKSLS